MRAKIKFGPIFIMFKIINRYLTSSFLMPFFGALSFFVLFLLTFQLFRIMRFAVQKNVDWISLFELICHICVSFLPISIPLAGLFAMIYAMGKLSDDAEIVAMRSFGMSKYKLFFPFLLASLSIAILTYSLSIELVPYSQDRFKTQMVKMSSKNALSEIKAGEFFTEIPGVTLFSKSVEMDGALLKDVFIYMENKNQTKVISAKKADFIVDSNDFEQSKLKFKFHQGNLLTFQKNDSDLQKVNFDFYEMPIDNQAFSPASVSKDSMLSSKLLLKKISKLQEKLKEINPKKNKNDSKNILINIAKAKSEYLTRINTPLQFLIFILVGFSLGIKKMRGQKNNASYFGIIFLVGHYFLFLGGMGAANKLTISPELATFGPTVLSLIYGLFLFRRMDWAS